MIINPFRFGVAIGDLATEIIADSPWAYYQLGETAGAATYVDSSSNARDLTNIVATVTAGSTALCAPGTSVDFNGTGYISSTNNQYGAAQSTAFTGNKAITYCVVLNVDSLAASRIPIHLGNASVGGSQGVFMQILTTGVVRFQLYDTISAGYKNIDSSAGAVATGNSYIIHCRRDVGGATTIKVNGATVGSGSMTGNIGMSATASSGGQRIILGALNAATPSTQMDGRQQHCAVFDSAVSDARIAVQVAASGL